MIENFGRRHANIVETLSLDDESATARLAVALAGEPALCSAVIELRGELGAGKTTLVRYLLQALGITGRIKSPTYAVVEPYELPGLHIWHFDFYRFADPSEFADAGFRDIFASPGLKLVEWPQQAGGYLPTADLVLELTVQLDERRQVRLTPQSAIGLALCSRALAASTNLDSAT